MAGAPVERNCASPVHCPTEIVSSPRSWSTPAIALANSLFSLLCLSGTQVAMVIFVAKAILTSQTDRNQLAIIILQLVGSGIERLVVGRIAAVHVKVSAAVRGVSHDLTVR